MRTSPLTFGSIVRIPSATLNRPPYASVLPSSDSPLVVFHPVRSLPLKRRVKPSSGLKSSAKAGAATAKTTRSKETYRMKSSPNEAEPDARKEDGEDNEE